MIRRFQIVKYMSDRHVTWSEPPYPQFIEGVTAYQACQLTACAKFGACFSNLRLRELQDDEPYPRGAKMLSYDHKTRTLLELDVSDKPADPKPTPHPVELSKSKRRKY